MFEEDSLLGILADKMGCEYISDLRFLSAKRCRLLADEVERLDAKEEDVRCWNDALNYLIGGAAEATAKLAKTAIVEGLRINVAESAYAADSVCTILDK